MEIKLEQIVEIISVIPNIFIYIIPGYICDNVFSFTTNQKKKDMKSKMIENIMLSYVICSIVKFVLSKFYDEVVLVLPDVTIAIIVFSIIAGFILGKITLSKLAELIKIRVLRIKSTISNNIFYDIVDKDDGTYARIYLKNERIVYYGAIVAHEQKEKYDDGFIIMNRYCAYKYGDVSDHIYEETLPKELEKNYFVSIKVSEISRIETIYAENSRVLNKLLIKRNRKLDNNEPEVCDDNELEPNETGEETCDDGNNLNDNELKPNVTIES